MKIFKKISMIIGFVLISHTNLSAAVSQPEIDALTAIYNNNNGANWTDRANWNVGDPCDDEWAGVYCSSISGLYMLSLHDNNLTGSIPPEIENLTNLKHLFLGFNEMTGSIPSEIGNLSKLESFSISYANFTGSIPTEIGNLTNLITFDLQKNTLTGSIPTEIGNLTNLTELDLNDNNLTGTIPAEIGNLTNLTYLSLSSNDLSGTIPAEIGNLTDLEWLSLYQNTLTGSIPSEIGNLTNLRHLSLFSNNLEGVIPSEIGNLINLTYLSSGSNNFTGSIPAEIGNLTNLTTLSLSSNNLSGTIPSEIGNLINLTTLSFIFNNLSGSIPVELLYLNNLASISATYNCSLYSYDTNVQNFIDTHVSLYLYDYQHILDTNSNDCGVPIPPPEPVEHTTCPTSNIDLNSTISATWDVGCVSANLSDSYAKYYTFTLDSTEMVYLTLTSNIDTNLFLLPDTNQSSAPIGENDDYGDGTNSQIGIELEAGTYAIEATTHYSGVIGDFDLSLTPTPPEPEPEPTCPVSAITLNSTIFGTWDENCDSIHKSGSYAKFYTFTLAEPKTITINLNSNIDTYLFLLSGTNQSSTPIATNDDYNGLNSQIDIELATGTYTIEAATYPAGQIGDFDLSLSGNDDNMPAAIIMYLLN